VNDLYSQSTVYIFGNYFDHVLNELMMLLHTSILIHYYNQTCSEIV